MRGSVLDLGPSPSPDLHLFAHYLRGDPNRIALLVINADRAQSCTLDTDRTVKRYTLTAPRLSGRSVELNGQELTLTAGGSLPQLAGARHPAGPLTVELAIAVAVPGDEQSRAADRRVVGADRDITQRRGEQSGRILLAIPQGHAALQDVDAEAVGCPARPRTSASLTCNRIVSTRTLVLFASARMYTCPTVVTLTKLTPWR